MDFSGYRAEGKLGTPADRTSNVKASNPGAEALAREQAKSGAIVLSGIDRLRAEVQTGRIMQANNEYNKELMDLTNELRQNKEQDALNTVEQFDEREQKIRSRIQKKYGSYLYGEAGRRYNDMLTRDYNSRRQSMINYQIGEAEKFNDTVLKNGLMDVANLATSDYMNPENVDGAMNKAAYLVASRYEHYGEEKIKQMTRVAQGNLAGMLVNTAISQNDWTGANDLLQRYGATMDPEKCRKLSQIVSERIQTERDTATLAEMVKQYKDPVSFLAAVEKKFANEHLGGFENYVMPTQGANIDEQVRQLTPEFRSALPQIGGILKYKFGIDAVISSGGRTREHQMEINPSAPNSHHIIRENGGDAVDIVLPDNVTDAQAKQIRAYFENSGAFKEVLFHDVGSGYHLHLGGYKGGLSRKATPTDKKRYMDNAMAEWNRYKHLQNLQTDASYNGMNSELMALRDAGNASWKDYTDCVERIAGGNPELRQKGYTAAKYWWSQVAGGNGNNTSNPWGGKKGGSRKGLDVGEKSRLLDSLMYHDYQTMSDWSQVVMSRNPTSEQYESFMNAYRQKKEGKGIFAYDWSGMESLFKAWYKNLGDDEKIIEWRRAKAYAIRQINKYRAEKGRTPTDEEVQQFLKDSREEIDLGDIVTPRDYWMDKTERFKPTRGRLAMAGIDSAKIVPVENSKQVDIQLDNGISMIVKDAAEVRRLLNPSAAE
ncbi:MAG: hypothetical protein IKZ43_07320 [Acidaminococcaceae bacterium]|nr:hypothetical protein [Acidaminococcaceae bacterium]